MVVETNGRAMMRADQPTQVAETARPSSGLALSFADMTMRVAQLDQFYREVMQEGTDYGKIPGTDKPTLYQPGAQMLDQIFGLSATFEVMPSSVIDWDRPIAFFHYIIRCRLVARASGDVVAEGIGSCNSHEDKYRWRNGKRQCPACGAEAIIKGKQEFGGGWLCFKKNNGCGAKYGDDDRSITGQPVGRVENEDSASLENTISKMAQKRAHVAATLNATGASRIFTQDIEDLPQFQNALVVQSESRPAAPDAAFAWVATFDAQWTKGIAKAQEIGANIPPRDARDKATAILTLKTLHQNIRLREESIALNETLSDETPNLTAQLASSEDDDADPFRDTLISEIRAAAEQARAAGLAIKLPPLADQSSEALHTLLASVRNALEAHVATRNAEVVNAS